jgi:hypothetical protein
VTTVTVAASPDRVWHALRDRDELRRWHGWAYDGLDAEIELIYFTEATVDETTRTLTTGGTRIELAPHGTGTAVTFRMVAPPDDPVWESWYDSIRGGWTTFAQQLRYALERHPGEDRETRYLEGPRRHPDTTGDRYALAGRTGEVWFRAEGQLGLTVVEWGDGLAVLTPEGAVLTGYASTPTGWEAA